MDDIVISRPEYANNPELFHIVSNAGCREKVNMYITEQLRGAEESYGNISWDVLPDQGLIALQGPMSAKILQDAFGPKGPGMRFQSRLDLTELYFGQNRVVTIAGLPNDARPEILVSRGGYTGEDGFELSIPLAHTATVAKHLLKTAGPELLRLAGLGARDSLRLEAGMCLYGQDLDDSTTPVEAGLGWIVHRDRREKGGFYGDKVILHQLKQLRDGGDPSRRRVGMVVAVRPARAGAAIIAEDLTQPEALESPEVIEQPRKVIGIVTSGCPSPTLGQNIAMGYVPMGYTKPGTELSVMVGGRERKAIVTKLPFIKRRLWTQPGKIKLTSQGQESQLK